MCFDNLLIRYMRKKWVFVVVVVAYNEFLEVDLAIFREPKNEFLIDSRMLDASWSWCSELYTTICSYPHKTNTGNGNFAQFDKAAIMITDVHQHVTLMLSLDVFFIYSAIQTNMSDVVFFCYIQRIHQFLSIMQLNLSSLIIHLH